MNEEMSQLPDAASLKKLEFISRMRLQMLLAQVMQDIANMSPRQMKRVLSNAFSTLTDGEVVASKLVSEEETRQTKTFIEAFNGIMLKIALKQAKEESTIKPDEENNETKEKPLA